MRHSAYLLAAIVFSANAVSAQLPVRAVFAGVLYQHGDLFAPSGPAGINSPAQADWRGWTASFETNVSPETSSSPHLMLVAEISGLYGNRLTTRGCEAGICPPVYTRSSATEYTALLGPRLVFDAGSFRPFVNALAGIAQTQGEQYDGIHRDADKSLALSAGGGLDIPLTQTLVVRAHGEWVRTRFYDHPDADAQNDTRLGVGVIIAR